MSAMKAMELMPGADVMPTNGIYDCNSIHCFREPSTSREYSNTLSPNRGICLKSDGVGYRSPCVSMQQYHGASSPAVQGRSVREFEEHTAQLRKENFNLKLRLYFVEQNMPALKSNGGDGCDTVMRELIDHKVEVEMLRRELEEKQGVLKDALQAIEDLENMQKETETNYEVKLEDLKQKMQHLEMERNAEKSENNELLNTMLGRSDIVTEHVNTLQKIRELEAQIKTHEDTISELQNKVDFFDSILEKREKTIQEFEDKTKNLEYQNAELQEELENCKKQIASNEQSKHEEILLATDDFLQENHFKEHLENCLSEARSQNETINNLQTFLSMKSENSKRILERFKEYEKCVDKMREERNLEKGKNKFLCSIIKKLRQQIKEMSRVTAGLTKSEKIEHSYTVQTFKRVTSTTKTQITPKSGDQLNATYTMKTNKNDSQITAASCGGEEFIKSSLKQQADIETTNEYDEEQQQQQQQFFGNKSSNDSFEGLQLSNGEFEYDCDDEEDLDKLLANSIDLSSVFMETISAMKHQTSTPAASSMASQKSSNYAWVKKRDTHEAQDRENVLIVYALQKETSYNTVEMMTSLVDFCRQRMLYLRIWKFSLKFLDCLITLQNCYWKIGLQRLR